MILPTLISNQAKPTDSFVGAHLTTQAPIVRQAKPDHTSCRFQIDRVVSQIESSQERQLIGAVFQDLLRLLECLRMVESHLRQVDAAVETFALFQLIHDEARVLVDFIREDGLSCVARNEDLVDTLDGITFAVSHDLQRVFETGAHAQEESASNSPNSHVTLGKLYRAHDILTNCLQQSTITLAMMFDPALVGATLFNNSDMRYRQSLQLCDDLAALIQLVETAEQDETFLPDLTTGIEKFRSESLECLMYSDWPQFESFCERIKVPASATELEQVFNQFRCYLETLLGQVRMRAVLANVFPVQFGGGDAFQPNSATHDSPRSISPSSESQEENSSWDQLAVAV